MRILPAAEAAKIALAKRGRTSKIGAMAFQLGIGEMLEILKTDWRGKNPTYDIINRLAKKPDANLSKVACEMAADGA